MVLLGDVGQVEARFNMLGDLLISMQDRSTVFTKCTTAIEIIGHTQRYS
jgi:hypothetical protein